ncbi:MAG: hypothetical protein JST09_19055 [Bacteroidetes bacterium]|nr:hypothetical protein [Bacteroidota bacterium]MBS1610437.1 hypothetical protein [Bacteroidota bacterium]
MSYEIYDHWVSFKFVVDGLEFLLVKSSVKKITAVGDDTIKISTGNCMGSISFHVEDVIYPPNVNAEQLMNYLNFMITLNLLPPAGGA